MNEIYRKGYHSTALLTLLPLLFWSDSVLPSVFATIAAIAIVAHWYIDYRQIRRKKMDDAIEGMFEAFGEKYDKTQGKELEKLEEDFYKAIVAQVIRKEEHTMVLPTVFCLCAFLFSLIFFGKFPLAFGIIALGVGDTSAAIIGTYFGKNKIFWNKNKSWQGFLGFFFTVTIASYLFMLAFPSFALFNPIKQALLVGLAGALIESLPIIDDNFSVPLVVSALIYYVGASI